ncbi:hypothetical protein M758_N013600 [Ceratodon purpureus]|nr:hypothetical protein M758_N013600 [Ceratodon purpureus]
MSTSLQWRHAGHMVAVAMVVLFIGSADAWGCPSGFKDCDPYKPGCETCIKNDVNNCGDCKKQCKDLPYTTKKCADGKCVYSCKPGWADCDKNILKNGCETDTGKDATNCGACGNCCKQVPYAVTKCSGGKCQEPVCKAGWGNCDKNMWSNGCEKDLGKDTANCGSCYNKCKVTLKGGEATCSGGKCGQQCKKGTKFDKTKNCCVPVKAY